MKTWYFLDAQSGRCLSTLFVQEKDEPLYCAFPSNRYTDLPKPACPAGFEARFVAGAWACYAL
jgi:hypothetical protein